MQRKNYRTKTTFQLIRALDDDKTVLLKYPPIYSRLKPRNPVFFFFFRNRSVQSEMDKLQLRDKVHFGKSNCLFFYI